ncbi:MAG: metal ABC transporter solute-binding protein, Zn/Mn family [Verrucomicrobiales bacterium]
MKPALFALATALGLFGCSPRGEDADDDASPAPEAPEAPAIAVSILPQREIVRRLAGDYFEILVFVKPGQDPHHFSASPQQVMGLARARAFFGIGMPFETTLIPRIRDTAPGLTIVDVSEGVTTGKGGRGEDGEQGQGKGKEQEQEQEQEQEHEDYGYDPHLWLSPPLLKLVARNTRDALIVIDPEHSDSYRANLAVFEEEVDRLHQKIEGLLRPFAGESFYVYHPAFTHFADAYDLRQQAVETGGKRPTPKQLMALIEGARRDKARVILVQPQFDPASANTVAHSIGGRVLAVDPLAEDIIGNLEVMARTIHDALERR